MQTEIVIAGFGGQGVLFAGQMLSYAAADSGLETTWIPSYGPEMRGGTANCTVIIADEEIGAPIVRNPQAALVMNLPSLEKFEDTLKPGGVLVVNSSLVDKPVTRTDLTVIEIPANEMADELGVKQLVNVLMIGAMLAHLPVLTLDDIKEALKNHLPKRKLKFLDVNYEALERGKAFALEGLGV
jgi:2-oxoglutarate ferredoxin oxidoreductase subunit gamma